MPIFSYKLNTFFQIQGMNFNQWYNFNYVQWPFAIFLVISWFHVYRTSGLYRQKTEPSANSHPCRNCPICFQVPIWARSDFPHVAAGGHMVWPGLEPHQIMIDKIIFEFGVMVLILYSDYIDIKMPKAKSTLRVRKYFFINVNLKRKL